MKHGGKRDGAGRKTKAEELGLPALIEEVIGEEGKRELIKILFEAAKDKKDFKNRQLLLSYIYGKPTEFKDIDITSDGDSITLDMSTWK